MDTNPPQAQKKRPIAKIILASLLLILIVAGIYIYRNFTRFLSESLVNSFNASVISDVYELKFDKIRVNIFSGSIQVINASVFPRTTPLKVYPYINSSLSLKAETIALEGVALRTLLRENRLLLNKIIISKPEIEFLLNGKRNIMLPFMDSTSVTPDQESTKRPIESFELLEFELTDASFHSINFHKLREFKIEKLSMAIHDLIVSKHFGGYQTILSAVSLSIGDFHGTLKKGPIQSVHFIDFNIGIDSLDLRFTIDTLTYQFQDIHTRLQALDMQTADSLFRVSMSAFDLSYQNQSVILKDISVTPNVSHAVIQQDYQFQHTEFSGTIGTLAINAVNFDSLIYSKKLFVKEVALDQIKAAIFKDKTKPIDSARRPAYLGQTISTIPLPVHINEVKATNITLDNTERKTDSSLVKVSINRAAFVAKNITNQDPKSNMEINVSAYLNNKIHFDAILTFPYNRPRFLFDVHFDKFNMPDLNPLIQAYTPAKINEGVVDEISFSGVAEQTFATGMMKFLYHDLVIDLELNNQAKWKSAIIAFTANTVLNSSNPVSANLPPREVQFRIERDMTKGFVNVLIKSSLNGLKETMIMSKENRKTHQEAKKKSKAGR